MSRVAQIAVLVAALLSLFAMLSSSAGAVTWHNSGATTLHATMGQSTLSSTSAGLVCPSGGTFTGTVAATPAVVLAGDWAAITGTASWSNCTLGVPGYAVDCGYTFTASTWAAGPPANTGGLVDVTCGVYLSGTKFCHIEGAVGAIYTNANGTTPGFFMFLTGGALLITKAGPSSCPLGDNDLGHFSAPQLIVTSVAGSPRITRTA